jgi:hypothetical protein
LLLLFILSTSIFANDKTFSAALSTGLRSSKKNVAVFAYLGFVCQAQRHDEHLSVKGEGEREGGREGGRGSEMIALKFTIRRWFALMLKRKEKGNLPFRV